MDKRLFHWLICMLLDVVSLQQANMMNSKNCAIVWGPGMIGASDSATSAGPVYVSLGAMEGLEDTRFGISLVESILQHYFETGTRPSSAQGAPAASPSTEPLTADIDVVPTAVEIVSLSLEEAVLEKEVEEDQVTLQSAVQSSTRFSED